VVLRLTQTEGFIVAAPVAIGHAASAQRLVRRSLAQRHADPGRLLDAVGRPEHGLARRHQQRVQARAESSGVHRVVDHDVLEGIVRSLVALYGALDSVTPCAVTRAVDPDVEIAPALLHLRYGSGAHEYLDGNLGALAMLQRQTTD